MKKFIGLFTLLLLPTIMFSLEIKGRIFSREGLDAVAGAVVILKQGKNTIGVIDTEDNGKFLIEDVKTGEYIIEIKAVGYYVEKVKIKVNRNINRNIYITPQSTSFLGEVEVIGDKEKGTVSKNVITKKMREKSATSMTGDPVEVFSKMPGVETPSFKLGGGTLSSDSSLSVRGGNGSENIALMEDATVPYPYHRFMGDSIFIDEVIDKMVLYKGVIPVYYGQALSSVLDVSLVDGKPGFHGKLNIGLLNLYLTLNGATDNEKLNWNMGVRRTHYDVIIPLFIQSIGTTDTEDFPFPYFWDSMGKIEYKPSKTDTFSFRWTLSTEPTQYTNLGTNESTDMVANYYTAMLNLKWKHIFSQQFYMENSFSTVFAGREVKIGDDDDGWIENATENSIQYKLLTSWYPIENLGFKFGGDIIYYPTLDYTNLLYGTYTNITTGDVISTNFMEDSFKTNMGIYALFFENDLYMFKKSIHLLWGVRVNYSDYIKQYSIDPRATLEYIFKDESKIYLSTGYLSQIDTDPQGLSLQTDDTNRIHYPGCLHCVAGSQINFSKTMNLTVDLYYKDYYNLLTLESNVSQVYSMEGGDAYVVGGEILLMKKPDSFPLYGWIGFSSHRTMAWRDEGIDPNTWAGISMGGMGGGKGVNFDSMSTITAWKYPLPPIKEWYTLNGTDYKININAIWDINKRWSLTFDFSWQSGRRYTAAKLGEAEAITIGTNIVYKPVWEEYNSSYMPDDHNLNIKIQFNFNVAKKFPATVFLQVQNVYNYRPIMRYTYNEDYTEREEILYPVGIYPIIGFSMKW